MEISISFAAIYRIYFFLGFAEKSVKMVHFAPGDDCIRLTHEIAIAMTCTRRFHSYETINYEILFTFQPLRQIGKMVHFTTDILFIRLGPDIVSAKTS